jgi:hypothetical protein
VSNPNPYQARQAKAHKRTRVLEPVFEAMLEAVVIARQHLQNEDPQVALRACHAIFQGGASVAKLYEVTELAERVEILEEAKKNTALN